MQRPKPLLLIILDGFGMSTSEKGNPLAEATKPTFDAIEQNYPFTVLQASGNAVGLPWGVAGNSEIGHLTIGAGHVIYHHLPRIINAVHDGTFAKNKALLGAFEHTKKHNSHLHIAGLISSGSVHSYIDHVYALLDLIKQQGITSVYLHAFTDGKDALPNEAAGFLANFEKELRGKYPNAHLASVIGRHYAMDRDDQWDRIEESYRLFTDDTGTTITSPSEYVKNSYSKDITDEFIKPAIVADNQDSAETRIRDNDALIFFNFREDSMREITHAFVDDTFDHFERRRIENLHVVTMSEYEKGMNAIPAFPTLAIEYPLARILSDTGLTHLHIAETQKYAHVTYFLNGSIENPFPGEKRILVESIHAHHIDESPEMRAREITDHILENFDTYDVIIANLANADMIGHTGNFTAAIRAVEMLDASIRRLMNRVMESDGVMVITADHGNIEQKMDRLTGERITRHSTNPVPLYLIGKQFKLTTPRSKEVIKQKKEDIAGIITDVSPTILELLGISTPPEITGTSLLKILS